MAKTALWPTRLCITTPVRILTSWISLLWHSEASRTAVLSCLAAIVRDVGAAFMIRWQLMGVCYVTAEMRLLPCLGIRVFDTAV